jgi:dipeptidyl-peptidase-4
MRVRLRRMLRAMFRTIVSIALLGVGCSGEPEAADEPEPNVEQQESRYAPPRAGDPDFLRAWAETNRFRQGYPRMSEVLPDESGVLFLRSPARSYEGTLYYFDAAAREERVLLTARDLLAGAQEELSEEERARRERMRLTATGIASFRVSPSGAQLLIPLSGKLFLVDRARIGQPGSVRELESTNENAAIDPRFSPDGAQIAVVRDSDLYTIDVATGVERRLTTRANPRIQNGLAEFVAQEEMGRMRGFWWSPDSRSIVYQETDHTGMEEMHILDPMHPESEPASWPYPRPGRTNAAVRLGVMAASGGPTRWIEWDRERYPYLASVVWQAAGPLTILVQSRDQRDGALLAVDAATGETRELLTEHDEAWINLDQTVPHWLEGGQQFLWSTEREGGPQLELRNADGTLARALTSVELGYLSLISVDEEHDEVWVRASAEPMEGHIYRVPLAEGEPTKISEERGMHDAVVGIHGHVIVHAKDTVDGVQETVVRDRDGTTLATLTSSAEEIPFEPNLSFETVTDRELRALVIRPREFDESLKYPVILYVYGGPTSHQVTATRTRYLHPQWQADHNFIVVCVDGRGTSGRGREFERAIRGDFISAPLEDHVAALRALGERHPEMDLERVGIWGWSFGGYFSAMAALREPDVFRAAIAGAPVSEWRDYDTHYTERYLGLPEADGEQGAYHRSSVLTFAVEAPPEDHRPLLIIHGTADDNVYFSHALKLQNALLRVGRPSDLLALSGLTHMVPEPVVAVQMHNRIMAFFEQHLRRAQSPR